MRQQEANQFDKGLCLDNNAIAVDNHTLTGALNATMITMNGNELVLQNDMGNSKVDNAALPSGFVPVGIKEFGGIVYVASYNPEKGTSELGCFPSPEQSLESENSGSAKKVITITSEEQTSKVQLLDMIRPGDKICIREAVTEGVEKFNNTFLERQVLIVDPKSGESFDASDSLKIHTNESDPLDTYTGNVAGELWVQEKLIIPAYIKVNIKAVKTADGITTVTFIPTACNSEGNEFTREGYTLTYTAEVTVTEGEVSEDSDDSLKYTIEDSNASITYTITPSIKDTDYTLKNLQVQGTIALSQLGTGEVTFGTFRYYNNILENEFNLEYDIQAYVDNETTQVDSIELEYREVITDNDKLSLGTAKTIALSTVDYFGSFTTVIPYDANFKTGKLYLGRIIAKTSEINSAAESIKYSSPMYTIITSAVTNNYYMQNPSASMFSTDASTKLELNWKVNWEESKAEQSAKQLHPSAMNTGTSLPSKKQLGDSISADSCIKLQTVQYGQYVQSFTPTLEVDTVDDFFPFTIDNTFKVSVNEGDATYQVEAIETAGTLNTDEIVTSVEETKIECESKAEGSISTVTNKVWNKSNNGWEGENGKYTIDLGYALTSQYLAKLAENGATEGDTYVQTYESNDCAALVPYLSLYSADSDKLDTVLGTGYFAEETKGKYDYIKPSEWWTFLVWRSSKRKRATKVAVIKANANYDNKAMLEDFGMVPGQGDYSNDQAIPLFETTSTNQNWRFYSSTTNDYLHNELKIYPALFLWQGCSDVGCTLHYNLQPNVDKVGTQAFSIPIMYDTAGEMYVIGQFRTNVGGKTAETSKDSNNLLYYIIDNFSHIYVRQAGQSVKFNYYKSSEDLEDFKYTNPFQAIVNLTIQADKAVTLKFGDVNDLTVVEGEEEYQLPQFTLAASSLDGSEKHNVTITLDSYDQVSEDVAYQAATPLMGNAAVVRKENADGTTEIETLTFAYAGFDSTDIEELDLTHAYYYDSINNKLIDCEKYAISNPGSTSGGYIAQAFYNKNFKVTYDANLDYNIIVINKANVSEKLIKVTNANIGKELGQQLISSIANKHVVNLPLVKDSEANKMYVN